MNEAARTVAHRLWEAVVRATPWTKSSETRYVRQPRYIWTGSDCYTFLVDKHSDGEWVHARITASGVAGHPAFPRRADKNLDRLLELVDADEREYVRTSAEDQRAIGGYTVPELRIP